MEALGLHTLPKIKFNLDKVAHNIITAVKLNPKNHEDNDFEDLLQSAKSFEQAFEWAKVNLSLEKFERFREFRNERLEVIPMHVLKIKDKPTPSVIVNSEGPSSRIVSQVNTEKTLDMGKAQEIDNIIESSRKSIKKQVLSTPPKEISSQVKGNNLKQVWDQFNQKWQDTLKMTDS